VLGRQPDADGLRHWEAVFTMPNGAGLVAQGLVASGEACLMVVDRDYGLLMHRIDDLPGRQIWLTNLAAAGDAETVMAEEMTASVEYFQRAFANTF
jgi:hypothetical protein